MNIFNYILAQGTFGRLPELNELELHRRNARILIEDYEQQEMLSPLSGYAREPLVPLAEACLPLINIVHDLYRYSSIALENTPNTPSDHLTRAESASIRLYTMEWTEGQSLYMHLNHTLRTANREELRPWFPYLKLFLTALAKIPCEPPQVIWRGVRKNISEQFPPGTQVTWYMFSSCTKTLSVLENDLYLGIVGERTLFSIEALNGRNIRAHSHYQNEDEILMLPGTYMTVKDQMKTANDLCIIHLKQEIPDEILLEPPFPDASIYPTQESHWYRKRIFLYSICLLIAIVFAASIVGCILGLKSKNNTASRTSKVCNNLLS